MPVEQQQVQHEVYLGSRKQLLSAPLSAAILPCRLHSAEGSQGLPTSLSSFSLHLLLRLHVAFYDRIGASFDDTCGRTAWGHECINLLGARKYSQSHQQHRNESLKLPHNVLSSNERLQGDILFLYMQNLDPRLLQHG